MNRYLLLVALLGIGSLAYGQDDLVVEAGKNYVVLASESRTFGDVTLEDNARITVQGGARLEVTGDFTTAEDARVEIQSEASLVVNGNFEMLDEGSIIMQARSGILVGHLSLTNCEVKMDTYSGFISNSDISMESSTFLIVDKARLAANNTIFVVNSSVSLISEGSLLVNGDLQIDDQSTVDFSNGHLDLTGPGNQTVTNCPEVIGTLNAPTSGVKTLSIADNTATLTVHDAIIMGRSILAIGNPVSLKSPEPRAILRVSGHIVTSKLSRNVGDFAEGNVFTFPIGSMGTPRIVQMIPQESSTGGVYTVEFVQGSAADLSMKVPELLDINRTFYHKIYASGDAPVADFAIFHGAGEGPFNRVVTWNATASVWAPLNGFPETVTSEPSLTGVAARYFEFDPQDDANPGPNIFLLGTINMQQPVITSSYSVLKKDYDGGFANVSGGILRFQFEEEYPEDGDQLSYVVYDIERTPTSITQPLPASYGDNRFDLNVSAIPAGEFGFLEVFNNKGEKWCLKFKKVN